MLKEATAAEINGSEHVSAIPILVFSSMVCTDALASLIGLAYRAISSLRTRFGAFAISGFQIRRWLNRFLVNGSVSSAFCRHTVISTAVRDIDGDERTDAVPSGYDDDLNRSIQIRIDRGDRLFVDRTQRRIGPSVWWHIEAWHNEVVFLDFNGDGTEDIVPQPHAQARAVPTFSGLACAAVEPPWGPSAAPSRPLGARGRDGASTNQAGLPRTAHRVLAAARAQLPRTGCEDGSARRGS